MSTVASIAAIRENKLLLVKKHDWWIFPGGKLEVGEAPLEALSRELSEELPTTNFSFATDIYWRGRFISPNSRKPRELLVYRGSASNWDLDVPSHDSIRDAVWTDKPLDYDCSVPTSQVIRKLYNQSLL